jgi:hypothetical protein
MNAKLPTLLGAAAAIAIAAMPACAQTVAGPDTAGNKLEIDGTAPASCIISLPEQGAIVNASVTPGPNSAQVTVNQLVDPNTSVPQAASVDMLFPIACNTAHTVTVSTSQGALVLQAAAPPPGPGFRNRLAYNLSAQWSGQQVTSASDSGTPVTIYTPNAAAGQLLVGIAIPSGGAPLEAGTYSDAIIVSLQPTN